MNTHKAIIKCNECGKYAVSNAGGIFKKCPCGESYVDQERHGAYYIRVGGNNADLIEQICPKDCKEKQHEGNKKLSPSEQRRYLHMKYNYL